MSGRSERGGHALLPRPGTYALFCLAYVETTIDAGRLRRLHVAPGLYAYTGSALGAGGLRGLLAHHLRPAARPHWHVDFLRAVAPVTRVWFSYGCGRREHLWAATFAALPGATAPFAGFGASDCNCASHLFRLERTLSMRAFIARLRKQEPAHPELFALELQE